MNNVEILEEVRIPIRDFIIEMDERLKENIKRKRKIFFYKKSFGQFLKEI